jgi:hypothetical protein
MGGREGAAVPYCSGRVKGLERPLETRLVKGRRKPRPGTCDRPALDEPLVGMSLVTMGTASRSAAGLNAPLWRCHRSWSPRPARRRRAEGLALARTGRGV